MQALLQERPSSSHSRVRILITASICKGTCSKRQKSTTDKRCACSFFFNGVAWKSRLGGAGRKTMRVLSPRLHPPLRSLLKCARGQQSVFDQAFGVLPVRRETMEGIGCCRMPCGHPAGVQRGTRCKAETCRGGHGMQRHAMRSTCWHCDAMASWVQAAAGHLEDPPKL